MPALPREVVLTFCQHCDWAEQCWQLRKYLFDDNPDRQELFEPRHNHFFNRLALILQEYWLQEVAKLHDPARQAGRSNLTVDYVFEYGEWTDEDRERLSAIRARLAALAGAIREVRNKLLSHHDLGVILSEQSLGAFAEGMDVAYFEALREYASVVHEAVLGSPYEFDDLTPNDVDAFMAQFRRGTF
ncbi:hypothetical protein [Rhodoferax sp. BAB1]|uniref:AbiU2 domain-containing protein n=1 Tax=Rhodoferax sp. BAB1 TaxID=2741720 RepID=UPI0015772193|nr:hypothetical protein [Rhodoferax sp. BAB1]QKO22773.1 hypothetical protein HTY51_13230 [Rhodoferax sp. BAB1]